MQDKSSFWLIHSSEIIDFSLPILLIKSKSIFIQNFERIFITRGIHKTDNFKYFPNFVHFYLIQKIHSIMPELLSD